MRTKHLCHLSSSSTPWCPLVPQNRVTGPGATLGFQVLQRELGGCVAQLGVEIWLMGRQGAPIGPRNLSKSLTFVSL